MKKMKKIAIGIASILSVGCLTGAVLSLNPVTVNAEIANISMVDGASVRLSSHKSGIGFTTRVNYNYYNMLDESYDVITGTLILPTDYLTDNGITEVTHETLSEKGEAGAFFQDVVNQGWKNTATAKTDGYYEYRGSLVNLNEFNYSREFSAVGYIGYKTAEDEGYTYEYTAYDEEKNSRAIDDIAFNAFVDRKATEQTVDGVEYKYAVEKDGTYSRYTDDERSILNGYMRDMEVNATKTTILQEEDGNLEYTTLKTIATDNAFNANAITSVTRNEKTVDFSSDAVDVSLNGIYNVTLSGEATHSSGAIVPANFNVSVDVWSEATKNVMIAAYDYSFVGGYTGQNTTVEKYTVGTYTVDGKEGTYYMLDVEGADPQKKTSLDAGVLIGKPLHSVEYYEQWIADNPYAKSYISVNWYFDNSKDPETNSNGDSPLFSLFNGFTKGVGTRNVWHGGRMELNEFLTSHYANFASYYDTVYDELDAIFAGEMSRFERFFDVYGVKTAAGELVYGYLMTTKLQKRMNNGYVTPMTLELDGIKTIETTELVDRNSVSSITPSLTASEQEVVTYWENNGYTVSYEFVKRYSDGTPISTANSVEGLATFAINSTVEDGIYYLNAIATKGEKTGVCLSKAYDIYDSTSVRVEYENFMHSDSQYAVISYYGSGAWMDALEDTNWAVSSATLDVQSVDKFLKNTTLYNVEFGKGEAENTYYALSLGSCSDNSIKNYSGRTVGYLEYDWTVGFTLDAYYQYIFTYVLPRHTVEYYKLYANSCDKFVMSFKGTYTETSLRTLHPVGVADGKISLYYGRTYSSNNQGAGLQDSMSATIQTLIDNYDSYATAKIPMQIIYSPYSFKTGTARLYEIFFNKN